MRVWVTNDPISAESVLPLVSRDEHGAVALFLGTVRDHNDGKAVHGVNYEAYTEMAQRVLRQIVEEAHSRLPSHSLSIAAVHRIGELRVGDVSIAIAVSSPHRAEAFEACRYVIEEVKKRVSIWKEERYVTGESAWL
jgi:molybdopterin synthase catalytic subunit